MFQSIVDVIVSGIVACFSWLDQILTSIAGSYDFILAFFGIVVVSRFLLSPLLGKLGAGSDKARKASRKDDE